jgi:sortase (surface protein transpeptidase)
MQKSLFAGAIIALVIVGPDADVFFTPDFHIERSIASAGELLALPMPTSTLVAADRAAWLTPQEIARSEEELRLEPAPAPSETVAKSATITKKKVPPPPSENPARLSIPSIGLSTRIIPVGVNKKGEMDVPDGSTMDVGWYRGGPRPGQIGSSVLDAHVYAAFRNLRYVKVGEEIIVESAQGTKLRFVVEDSRVYELSELTPQMLFGQNDGRRLHLITCAGKPVGDTYSHRLVVYARYVGEA